VIGFVTNRIVVIRAGFGAQDLYWSAATVFSKDNINPTITDEATLIFNSISMGDETITVIWSARIRDTSDGP
jgi:hypothetical protein